MHSLHMKDKLQNIHKVPLFQQRSRLKSLKQLGKTNFDDHLYQSKLTQQHILQILQKKLTKDNLKLQNQEALLKDQKMTSVMFSSKHNTQQQCEKKLSNLKQGNKLFQYFEQLYKRDVPEEKVEREKVNFVEKQFEEIRMKIKDKLQVNKIKLNEMNKNLTKKYLEIHGYHEQRKELEIRLKQEVKTKQVLQNTRKLKLQKQSFPTQSKVKSLGNSMSLRPPSLKQKIYILQESIRYIKREISTIQEQVEAINSRETSIQEEWIHFLKLFLNCGYYMSEGSDTVIEELKKMNVKISMQDLFGSHLDENAKKYFVSYYQNFHLKTRQNVSEMYGSFQRGEQRNRIKSNIEMTSLLKQSNLKEIYSNTQQVMINLIKNSSFRNSPDMRNKGDHFLPKIDITKQLKTNKSRVNTGSQSIESRLRPQSLTSDELEQLRRHQISRINHMYYGNGDEAQQKGKQMKRILFGFGVK